MHYRYLTRKCLILLKGKRYYWRPLLEAALLQGCAIKALEAVNMLNWGVVEGKY